VSFFRISSMRSGVVSEISTRSERRASFSAMRSYASTFGSTKREAIALSAILIFPGRDSMGAMKASITVAATDMRTLDPSLLPARDKLMP
jgi:hypothetical protein